jgi:hypothetical protein
MTPVKLAAPVPRAPAAAVQLSQVLLAFDVLTAGGARVMNLVLAVEGRLSPAALAELEALAAAAAKSGVEAAEAAPPRPAEPQPGPPELEP